MIKYYTYTAMRDFDGTYARLEVFKGPFKESMRPLIEEHAEALGLDPHGVVILPIVQRTLYGFGFVEIVAGPHGYFFAIGGIPSVFQAWSCPLDAEREAINFACQKVQTA